MVLIYKFINKALNLFLNILFVMQITLMVLVFLTATYWFMTLINVSFFDFVQPIADVVTNMIHTFYHQQVEIGGVFFDGSLLLFDLIAVAFVYGITKAKIYIYRLKEKIQEAIEECSEHIENKFNKKLQKDLHKNIKQMNDVAILVEFAPKNTLVDAFWGGDSNAGVEEKEQEAFKALYSSIKNMPECKFAKTDNKMLILLNDFDKIDNLLKHIDLSINRVRTGMKSKKWALHSYVAVEVYDASVPFKEVYPVLEKLISLRINNEAICLGNFCMRYDLHNEPQYEPFLKGTYNLGEEGNLWSLVKKN